MKIPVSLLSTEAILSSLSYWEDLKHALCVLPTEDGGVTVFESNGGNNWGEGKTFREALIDYAKVKKKDYHYLYLNDGDEQPEIAWDA